MKLNHRNCTKTLATAFIAAIGLLSAPAPARADDAADHAASFISQEKDTIAALAHPTATLQHISLVDQHSTSNGVCLEYEFHFESAFGNDFFCNLEFEFGSSGDFSGELTVKRTTALVKPFAFANTLVEAIRDELLKDPDVNRSTALVAILREADAEKICELSLLLGD